MTLAELRAQLAALNVPDDTPVILATDAEGNGFSPLRYAIDEQRAAANDEDWDHAPDRAMPAIFLWPTN